MIAVNAIHEDQSFNLEVSLIAGRNGLDRVIEHPRVQKPGIALAGYIDSIRPNRVQVLGKTEVKIERFVKLKVIWTTQLHLPVLPMYIIEEMLLDYQITKKSLLK